jgi:hypothetical protein
MTKWTLGQLGQQSQLKPIKANKMTKQTQLVLRSLRRSRIKPNLSRRSLWRSRKQTQNVRNLLFKKECGIFFNRGLYLYPATLLKAQETHLAL